MRDDVAVERHQHLLEQGFTLLIKHRVAVRVELLHRHPLVGLVAELDNLVSEQSVADLSRVRVICRNACGVILVDPLQKRSHGGHTRSVADRIKRAPELQLLADAGSEDRTIILTGSRMRDAFVACDCGGCCGSHEIDYTFLFQKRQVEK